ncbi:MAG: UvrD-helicase domain-containing protein [Blastocatellia bacterium]|nr:UvrD-helicase domain-containing protein [Blastocatellia bacterium]MCS7157701.1 UvrD-helicase domain-containing protein [Blastocatellia bacterium]MCX7751966.1 UvrD-helicase domain-containing protein [Blastocatellia bacterium]MDW8167072.1 UvrD-helicase domain-containing protein [Acidobacteriota bacterium]MDW8257176.1 UvrD-helicase domain-containing protein [Acidobacteriota bacterium]
MSYLDDLNPAQRAAVLYMEGPLLVLAGAGSGKTRVITYKIAYMLDHLNIDPAHILAVTFTNKAAEEMRGRVARLLNADGSSALPWIGTFHGFCTRLLRRHIERLGQGYTSDFSIYDEEDQLRLLRTCLRERGLDERTLSLRAIQARISRAKSRGLTPADLHDDPEWMLTPERALALSLFEQYEQRLRAANALDFDDLLLKAVALLRQGRDLRARYREQFRFILVDEYQDTNPLQLELLLLLAAEHTVHSASKTPGGVSFNRHLCVVGDPDQSIYRWRGADPHNVLEFERHFPNARLITLERNYRSTKTILAVANAVIRHNTKRKEKILWTENEDGPRVGYYLAETAEDEADFVIERIRAHLERESQTRVAVLYRTNAQSRLFEEACRRVGLPFRIVGGFSFYKRAEIRDVLAYVRLALNPWDDESLRRILNVPPRGIGRKTLDALEQWARTAQLSLWDVLRLAVLERRLPERALHGACAFIQLIERIRTCAQRGTIAETFRLAIHETGYAQALRAAVDPLETESRLSNLEELLSAAAEADERGERVREFVDRTALVSDADDYDPNAPVTLMTMHSAKGLEFSVVFIVGLEEGLFPHARSSEDPEELEEERRLFYVAITRAERQLYLTHARTRRYQGEPTSTTPSRFLRELPSDLLEDLSSIPKRPSYTGPTYNSIAQIEQFFRERGRTIALGKSPAATQNVSHEQQENASTSPRSRFPVGARVRHPHYGVGQVIGREERGGSVTLTVVFAGAGKRKFIEGIAPLELVS